LASTVVVLCQLEVTGPAPAAGPALRAGAGCGSGVEDDEEKGEVLREKPASDSALATARDEAATRDGGAAASGGALAD
jgi:hypothetical protein